MAEYTIQEISTLFALPPATLRYYEQEALLIDVKRSPSGQRIYEECHVNRLKTICCFKQAGMSLSQLKKFFSFEGQEEKYIDDIVELMQVHEKHLKQQLENLKQAYTHMLRKSHYFKDKQTALKNNQELPDWKNYRDQIFTE